MGNLIVIAVVIVVLMGLLAAARLMTEKKTGSQPSLPYRKEDTLLSKGEAAFAQVLEQAAGESVKVTAKVRLADVIAVKKGLEAKDRQRAFNRIQSKHLDFVLCSREDWRIIAAIELDDRSHRHSRRQERDKFVDEALAAAGVPLVRFPARQAYKATEVHAEIAARLGARTGVVEAVSP